MDKMSRRIKAKYFGRTSMRSFGGPQDKKTNRIQKHRTLTTAK